MWSERGPGTTGTTGTTTRILDVAERLLQARGYNGFSYADVATELGITRAALHYHYPGKAELGEALIARYAARFSAALADLDATSSDAPATLEGYAELYAEVLGRHRMCLCGMLAAEYLTLPPAMQRGVTAFFEHSSAWLQAVLERGRREGTLAFSGPAADSAAMVLGGMEGAMLVSRLSGDVDGFRAAAARLLAGLSTAADQMTA
ncbi:MAG TPA: TetR/AcrR family transcriptional regulator [Modestobacter sp.]|nr:TetR/AcrR family transcriptional regulator [Modestobacter sp.]